VATVVAAFRSLARPALAPCGASALLVVCAAGIRSDSPFRDDGSVAAGLATEERPECSSRAASCVDDDAASSRRGSGAVAAAARAALSLELTEVDEGARLSLLAKGALAIPFNTD
jgi:hypothetical protein